MDANVSLSISREDLGTILSALSNVREFINDGEFHAVMGVDKDEVLELMARLNLVWESTRED